MRQIPTPEEIYQRFIEKQLTKEEAANFLKKYCFHNVIDNEEAKWRIPEIVMELSIVSDNAKTYIKNGTIQEEAKVLGILEAILGVPFKKLAPEDFISDKNAQYYSINADGHIIKLVVGGYKDPKLLFFFQKC